MPSDAAPKNSPPSDPSADSAATPPDADTDLEGSDEGDLSAPSATTASLEKADRSLSEFKRWSDEGDLVLNPEWQSNYVWTIPQASRLIESFLLNIPIPVVYLSTTAEQRYEVIDGLQRLNTVFRFFDNEFPLKGLEIKRDLNGRRFRDLDKPTQRHLKNSTLRSFELASDTNPDIHFVVFEKLNTGGTKLNEMEIRNCIFRGALNDLIKELAVDQDFVSCMNQKGLQKRMHDRALVLRFLAFYERTQHKCGAGIKKFLNEFLETYRNPPEEKLREYRKVCKKCMKASLTVFGEYGFRLRTESRKDEISDGERLSEGEWATRVNASVFQCLSTSFAQHDLGAVTRSADRIYEEYLDLLASDKDWVDRVRRATGERGRLSYVFGAWDRRLREVLQSETPNDGRRTFSRRLKKQMFEQDRTCRICGNEIRLLDDAVLDHEKHYWRGGATVPDNARLAHRLCNMSRPDA